MINQQENRSEVYEIVFYVSTEKNRVGYKIQISISDFNNHYIATLDSKDNSPAVWNQAKLIKNKSKEEFIKVLKEMILGELLDDLEDFEKMTRKEKRINKRKLELTFKPLSKKIIEHYFGGDINETA